MHPRDECSFLAFPSRHVAIPTDARGNYEIHCDLVEFPTSILTSRSRPSRSVEHPSRWPCDSTRPFVVMDGNIVNSARKDWILDQGKEALDLIIHPEDGEEDEVREDDVVTVEESEKEVCDTNLFGNKI